MRGILDGNINTISMDACRRVTCGGDRNGIVSMSGEATSELVNARDPSVMCGLVAIAQSRVTSRFG